VAPRRLGTTSAPVPDPVLGETVFRRSRPVGAGRCWAVRGWGTSVGPGRRPEPVAVGGTAYQRRAGI